MISFPMARQPPSQDLQNVKYPHLFSVHFAAPIEAPPKKNTTSYNHHYHH